MYVGRTRNTHDGTARAELSGEGTRGEEGKRRSWDEVVEVGVEDRGLPLGNYLCGRKV